MSLSAYEQSLMNYAEYAAHKWILLAVPPVLLFVGTLGNVFSFCILVKNTKKASTYRYLSVLAVFDLIVLYVGLLRLWVKQLFGSDVLDMDNTVCKLGVFLGYLSSDISVWLIVVVTIERFIAVKFPLKAPRICNARNTRVAITSVIVLFVIVNMHFLWSVELQYFRLDRSLILSFCMAKESLSELVEVVWPWVDAGIYTFVPFVIIIILNSLIVRNIISAKNERYVLRHQAPVVAKTNTKNGKPRRKSEVSKRITVTLLAVSMTFLITTLPMNLVMIYTSLTDEASDDDATFAKRKLRKTMAEMFMYLNHSINFILYCATGKKFRDQFKAMIGCFQLSPFLQKLRRQSLQLKLSFRSFRTTSTDTEQNQTDVKAV